MKSFVTGGAGFIGSNLVNALKDKDIEFYIYDITDGFDVRNYPLLKNRIGEFKPDVVYHLASILGTSETIKHPNLTAEVNILGTLNVLKAVNEEENTPRLVYSSKPSVWRNPYTITKIAAEEFIRLYGEHCSVILRLHNVYGPRQKLGPVQKAVPTFIMNALQGKPIPVFGDGEQSFDWIYIDDAVKALISASKNEGAIGETVDIGTGTQISVNHIIKIILDLTESTSEIEYFPWRKGEGPERHLAADTSKADDLLKFQARVEIVEGLEKTIEYYRFVELPLTH